MNNTQLSEGDILFENVNNAQNLRDFENAFNKLLESRDTVTIRFLDIDLLRELIGKRHFINNDYKQYFNCRLDEVFLEGCIKCITDTGVYFCNTKEQTKNIIFNGLKSLLDANSFENIFSRIIKANFLLIENQDDIDRLFNIIDNCEVINDYHAKFCKEQLEMVCIVKILNFSNEQIINNFNDIEEIKQYIFYELSKLTNQRIFEIAFDMLIKKSEIFITNQRDINMLERIIDMKNFQYLKKTLKTINATNIPNFTIQNNIETARKIFDIILGEDKNVEHIFNILENVDMNIDDKKNEIQNIINNLNNEELNILLSVFIDKNIERNYIALDKNKEYGTIKTLINSGSGTNIGTFLLDTIKNRVKQITTQKENIEINFEDVNQKRPMHTLLSSVYTAITLTELDEDNSLQGLVNLVNEFDNLLANRKQLENARENLESRILKEFNKGFIREDLFLRKQYLNIRQDFLQQQIEKRIKNGTQISEKITKSLEDIIREDQEINSYIKERQDMKSFNGCLLSIFDKFNITINQNNEKRKMTLEDALNEKTGTQIGTKLYNKLKQLNGSGRII